MSYGLDNFIFEPPLGAIISILMIFGLDCLGLLFLRFFGFDIYKKENIWLRFQSPLIGTASSLFFISPIVLSGYFVTGVPQTIAALLIALGLKHFGTTIYVAFSKSYSFTCFIRTFGFLDWSLAIIFLGYIFLALAPVTEADALDYHIGSAIDILNTGSFPFQPEWFHSRLSGSGEILISIGLSVGSEQFSSMLQLVGLSCVVLIFLTKPVIDKEESKWIALVIASTPALLALVPAAKPLLLPSAMTTSALAILNFNLRDSAVNKNSKDFGKYYFLLCFLAMTAATMKANFIVSAAIIVGLAFFINLRFRNLMWGLSVSTFTFIFILFPFFLWKFIYFNGDSFHEFFTIFPGSWPGYKNFEMMLVNYRDTNISFPLSLILPSSLGTVTTILGFGTFYFLSFARVNKFKSKYIVVASLFLIIGYVAFGQQNARFFWEPYLWILLAYNFREINIPSLNYLKAKPFRFAIATQAFATTLMISYGVFQLFPGAISLEWRKSVMINSAQGYDVMMWLDDVLPENAVLISSHRSVALSPRKTIATDWFKYVKNEQKGIDEYLSLIALKDPKYFLLISKDNLSDKKNPEPHIELPCVGEVYAGPFFANTRTRNPFHSRNDYYAWVSNIDLDCLNIKEK